MEVIKRLTSVTDLVEPKDLGCSLEKIRTFLYKNVLIDKLPYIKDGRIIN